MKAEFDKHGVLNIIPKTWKEDEQLRQWYLENYNKECRKVIIFNSKSK